jgi:hypothetical protein
MKVPVTAKPKAALRFADVRNNTTITMTPTINAQLTDGI